LASLGQALTKPVSGPTHTPPVVDVDGYRKVPNRGLWSTASVMRNAVMKDAAEPQRSTQAIGDLVME